MRERMLNTGPYQRGLNRQEAASASGERASSAARRGGISAALLLVLVAALPAAGLADAGAEAADSPDASGAQPTTGAPVITDAEGADETGETEFPPEIEKLLTESSDEVDYAVTERCINVRSIRDTDILDERHIVFEVAGGKLYLVQFKRRCYDLRPSATLFFEPRGNRLCQLDMIRASRSFGIGPPDMGIPCSIPGFIEITPEQVALLREALKARRKAPSAPPAEEEPPVEPVPESESDEAG
jgi:hypothetical protein